MEGQGLLAPTFDLNGQVHKEGIRYRAGACFISIPTSVCNVYIHGSLLASAGREG